MLRHAPTGWKLGVHDVNMSCGVHALQTWVWLPELQPQATNELRPGEESQRRAAELLLFCKNKPPQRAGPDKRHESAEFVLSLVDEIQAHVDLQQVPDSGGFIASLHRDFPEEKRHYKRKQKVGTAQVPRLNAAGCAILFGISVVLLAALARVPTRNVHERLLRVQTYHAVDQLLAELDAAGKQTLVRDVCGRMPMYCATCCFMLWFLFVALLPW